MRLRHWQRVPAGLLPLLAEAPWLADLHLLRRAVDEAHDDWQVGRVVTARMQMLRDTARLATLLRPDGGAERILLRCRRWDVLKAVHDDFLRTIRELGWESVLRSDVNPAQALPPPPIPSCGRFTAIRTIAELIDEGEKMHHCVVTRAPEVMEGRSAIYKVNVAGERATIEISVGPDREPLIIEEFRLVCNAEPSEAAWAIAGEWLDEGRRQWNEALAAGCSRGANQAA